MTDDTGGNVVMIILVIDNDNLGDCCYYYHEFLPTWSNQFNFCRSMNHKHIVKFFSYFEDSENVYMILELCRKKVG